MSTTADDQAPAPRKRWGLKGKLILSMLLVGVIPLLAGLVLAFLQGSQEIREVSGEAFKALAIEASRKLDLLVGEEITRTSRIAADAEVILALERYRDSTQALTPQQRRMAQERQRSGWDSGNPEIVKSITDHRLSRVLQEYFSGSRSEPDQLRPHVVRAATQMLFLTDIEGSLIAALTNKPAYSHRETAWWQGAFNKGVGKLYLEDLHFDDRANSYVFTISVPVMDSLRYGAVGVLHRVIDAKEFFSPSTHPIRFGRTGHVMLIDSRGVVLSCPILPTGVKLSDPAIIPMVTKLEAGWVQTPSDGHGGTTTSIVGFSPLPETSRATNGSVEGGAWHTFVWQSSDELFAPVNHLFTWMSIFGTLAMGLLAGLGAFAAGRIVTPVRHLQAAARAIGQGALREPIVVKTGDELEELAEELTRMNAQLEQSFAGLETQVEQKSQQVRVLQKSTDQILDAVPAPIFLIDREAHVHYLNRASRDAFELHEATGKSPLLYDLLRLSEGSREKLGRELAFMGNGHAAGTRGEPTRTRTPSTRDPLAQSGHAETEEGRRELQVGKSVFRYEWFPMASLPGEQARIGLVLRNATDESRLQEQLIEAEKKGSLGILTAGIGHELNNPLFGILGLGEAIQHESSPEQMKEFAQNIVQHGKRMATIIRDFTGVARADSQERRQPVDLIAQLDLAVAMVQTSLPESELDVQRQFCALPPIAAIPEEIQQAFANMILNAVQAMKGKGRLILKTDRTPLLLNISIQDNGPGIPPNLLTKVFDPFFTTKQQGEGSGLGLTIARRLLMKSGGHVRIESTVGQGTTCLITFPAPQEPAREETSA